MDGAAFKGEWIQLKHERMGYAGRKLKGWESLLESVAILGGCMLMLFIVVSAANAVGAPSGLILFFLFTLFVVFLIGLSKSERWSKEQDTPTVAVQSSLVAGKTLLVDVDCDPALVRKVSVVPTTTRSVKTRNGGRHRNRDRLATGTLDRLSVGRVRYAGLIPAGSFPWGTEWFVVVHLKTTRSLPYVRTYELAVRSD